MGTISREDAEIIGEISKLEIPPNRSILSKGMYFNCEVSNRFMTGYIAISLVRIN